MKKVIDLVKCIILKTLEKNKVVVVLGSKLLILGVGFEVNAEVFYISPKGSDSNSGTSASSPWRTFQNSIPELQPGDTLVLMDGTYNGDNSGYLSINCNANNNAAVDGTAAKPITIKAENEREAFLQGDGSARPFRISNCSYWNIEGLRAENGDFRNEVDGAGAGSVFVVTDSNNITMKRLLGAKNNRYFNSHIYVVGNSSDILIEESEAYYFHRHGFSVYQSSFITLRRNYVNSRGYERIPGGYEGHGGIAATRGDEGLILYRSDDSIMENNISEGNEYLRTTGSRNRVLGNITIDEIRGIAISRPAGTDNKGAKNNIAINNVSYNAINLGFSSTSPGVTIENGTSIASGGGGFAANNRQSGEEGAFQLEPEYTVRNSLSVNSAGNGFVVEDPEDFSVLVLEYLNSFNNRTDYSLGTGSRKNSMSVDPELGNCIVYIPKGSPMKGAGKNGADIGANIIFRYEDGVLTNQKLWNQNTGQFPCGATVSGVNDNAKFPDSSCVNVHERLNVGVNGCAIP